MQTQAMARTSLPLLGVLGLAALLVPRASALAGLPPANSAKQAGQVITVRLACIDAPEIRQVPQGPAARDQLKGLLPLGSTVELRSKAIDRYGRRVAELLRGGRNLNQELVGSGAAFVYWQYIAGCDRQTYSRLETQARLRRLGVWSTSGGSTRPWDYRRGRQSSSGGGTTGARSSPTTPDRRRYRCSEIGSYARAQELLRQGHSYLDGNADGEACEGLRR